LRSARIRSIIITVMSGIALGCSEAPLAEQADRSIEWTRLNDGSLFFIRQSGSDNESAIRCWQNGKLYDCVSVRRLGQSYRAVRKELLVSPKNEKIFDFDDGYACIDKSELISKNGDVLIQNYSDSEWSNDFKNDFLLKNSVSGGKAFMCLSLLRILRSNSLRTLGTTVVSINKL
jgi:hypothetical protein